MTEPWTATYRLQLHEGFCLRKAAENLEYLARLGVNHVYLSTCLQAAPGSTHGYDVTDPTAQHRYRFGRYLTTPARRHLDKRFHRGISS